MYTVNSRNLGVLLSTFRSTKVSAWSEGDSWDLSFQIATCGESYIARFAHEKIPSSNYLSGTIPSFHYPMPCTIFSNNSGLCGTPLCACGTRKKSIIVLSSVGGVAISLVLFSIHHNVSGKKSSISIIQEENAFEWLYCCGKKVSEC